MVVALFPREKHGQGAIPTPLRGLHVRVDARILILGLILVAGAIGRALGSMSGNVALVSTTFAAVADGVGGEWIRRN